MKRQVLTDTGYWIGLIDPRDEQSERANVIADLIMVHDVIFPWPCLYETLRTKYCRRRDSVLILENSIKSPNITLLDDRKYRASALRKTLMNIKLNKASHSLADNVLREIIEDINVRIDYLVTFNTKDFSDICARRRIEILNEHW